MMELRVSEWKEFRLDRLFVLRGGFYNKKPEHSVDGRVPFLGSTENDNGVTEFYSLDDIRAWDKVGLPDDSLDGKLFDGGCVAVTVNGSVCNAFYQVEQFTCSHDITALYIPSMFMTESVGLFIASVIMKDKYRWSYGRKPHSVEKFGKSRISLPVQHDASGKPIIDQNQKYSDDGYVPDWDFMEQYMKSLNHPSLTTNRGYKYPTLGVDKWKEFQVGRLFQLNIARSVDYGNTTEGNTIFVGRTSENNGVQGYVSETPVEDGNCIIIGMVGSNLAFYQDKPFAASQNILVLRNDMLNRSIAMFLCTVLSKCVEIYRDTYSLPLGKEKIKSRGIKLPVQHDASGQPLIDPLKKYSDDGYIPDWAFMEQYIESLPGSDLLK